MKFIYGLDDKKLYLFILFVFILVIFTGEKAYSQTILKGGITALIEKGHTIEVNLATPVNFYFSEVGDKVIAFTTEDILTGGNLYIPKGSVIEGIITKIKTPKHFGQDGAFEIDFSQITTQNNITIPIYASVSTDISSKEEKIAKILTYDSALVAYGTLNGALAGIQYGGIPLAILSHGISVLAGAGVGLGAGVIGSVARKGKIPSVLTSIRTRIVLKSDFYVLRSSETRDPNKEFLFRSSDLGSRISDLRYKGFRFFPSAKENEISLSVNKIRKEHSNIYGDYFIIEFNLKNNSSKTINLSDMVVESKFDLEPLHPDLLLSGLEALKSVKPLSEVNSSLAFILTTKIDEYSLAIIDPLDGNVIVKLPLKGYKGVKSFRG